MVTIPTTALTSILVFIALMFVIMMFVIIKLLSLNSSFKMCLKYFKYLGLKETTVYYCGAAEQKEIVTVKDYPGVYQLLSLIMEHLKCEVVQDPQPELKLKKINK